MQAAGEARSVSVFDLVTSDNTATVLPVDFGVGRDEAVRILSVHYTVTQWSTVANQFDQWAAALSENPDHELTAPAGGIVANIGLLSLYGWVFESGYIFEGGVTPIGFTFAPQKTHHMELHGLLRPRRQRVVFWNEVGGACQFRCEIIYRPVGLPREDVKTLDRTRGSIRRS